MHRPYGRFFYIPRTLAQLGHHVSVLVFSYQNDPTEHRQIDGMDWYSVSLRPWRAGMGLVEYQTRARELIQSTSPDWVVGLSDTWYGILAQHLGARYGIKTVVDAYDNYESYLPGAKPLHWAWRRACSNATLLTAPGPDLIAKLVNSRSTSRTCIIPMSADPQFKPLSRDHCRDEFSLPRELTLVGYCGSFYQNRGINQLLEALSIL
ncbi:MAG: glycosyltransferase, partial [Gallionella sp.]